MIAGSIELFGDGPFAWRLGSLVFGTLAIVGMFALVRSAGGGPWTALGAAGLMAADNLLIVHGRIGTLDIYALAPMLWAGVLYLRGRPLLAGALVGVAACMKLVGVYVVFVLMLLEALRWLGLARGAGRRCWRLARLIGAGAAVFFGLLAILDGSLPHTTTRPGKLVTGGPFAHLGHMLSYAAAQTSPHGPQGIASYPFGWLVDYKPITYLNINPSKPSAGLIGVHPAVHFLGLISPPILLVGVPGARVRRGRGAAPPTGSGSGAGGARRGVVRRHVRPVPAVQRLLAADDLHLLHGRRDAGAVRGRGVARHAVLRTGRG